VSKPGIPAPPHNVIDTDLGHQIEHSVADGELSERDNETGFDKIVNRTVEAFGAAILIAITCIVFANATLRYVFNSGLIWGDEVAIALAPWLAMLGMFLSVRRREVIRIEHFATKFPRRAQPAIKSFAELVSAVAFVYLAFVTFEYLKIFSTDKTVYLRIPTYWFQSALLIGGLMLAAAFAVDTFKAIRAPKEEANT
jgi:TRAP-type C4-dicarboxylate transport system permease small subunit